MSGVIDAWGTIDHRSHQAGDSRGSGPHGIDAESVSITGLIGPSDPGPVIDEWSQSPGEDRQMGAGR